jgi:DNA modification methylase
MLIRGDARHLPLKDESVDCCITSPPYFGLRDYGTARWDGGDAECDHKKPNADIGHIAHSTLGGGKLTNAAQIGGFKAECGKCGASRIDRQIGLEESPAAYVAQLVAVFREVWRVLKPQGTLWLNLGDSYVGGAGGRGDAGRQFHTNGDGGPASYKHDGVRIRRDGGKAKPKDLLGVPWMVAFALREAGWYLRSDIIWAKPNPMPESVTDRPTRAHEYLFLLAKQERYYYDADAIREADNKPEGWAHIPNSKGFNLGGRLDGGIAETGNAQTSAGLHRQVGGVYHPLGRNKRSVWTVSTMPYAGAHFATMPEKLIEPCILAGCPMGGLVLDPFVGSGTVVEVANRYGRRGVGVDLSYQDLAKERTAQRGLRFAVNE